jgi:hypothetical protein
VATPSFLESIPERMVTGFPSKRPRRRSARQARQDFHHRGLTGTVGAYQSGNFAGMNRQRRTFERYDSTESLFDSGHFKQGIPPPHD